MGVIGGRGGPFPPVTLPNPEDRGHSQGCLYGSMGHEWLQEGRVSPAAGIVGALGGVADGAKGPLGAADGGSARIPAGQVGPVRGWGQGLGLGVSAGQGALRRGRGEEEFKGWSFLQEA